MSRHRYAKRKDDGKVLLQNYGAWMCQQILQCIGHFHPRDSTAGRMLGHGHCLALLGFAGTIDASALALMTQAIEDGCAQNYLYRNSFAPLPACPQYCYVLCRIVDNAGLSA